MAEYPDTCRYSEEHEWISVESDIGTIGITDHAQAELGDVVYVELPAIGDKLEAGETFGTIESVKAVSELYAPVSGEVTEVHDALVDRPELVNEDPHGEAWMIRIKIADADQVDELLSAPDYVRFLETADAGD
jgi:glycine cleavage system H protein